MAQISYFMAACALTSHSANILPCGTRNHMVVRTYANLTKNTHQGHSDQSFDQGRCQDILIQIIL